MALLSSTVNGTQLTHDHEAHESKWHEAWRNVDDYLRALNVSERLRQRIQDQIFVRAQELSPTEPVTFVMEQLFENAHLQRILKNAVHSSKTQPEVEFTSMLPEKMEFVPVAENTANTSRWIVACTGIIALGLGVAFVVLRLVNGF